MRGRGLQPMQWRRWDTTANPCRSCSRSRTRIHGSLKRHVWTHAGVCCSVWGVLNWHFFKGMLRGNNTDVVSAPQTATSLTEEPRPGYWRQTDTWDEESALNGFYREAWTHHAKRNLKKTPDYYTCYRHDNGVVSLLYLLNRDVHYQHLKIEYTIYGK